MVKHTYIMILLIRTPAGQAHLFRTGGIPAIDGFDVR